MKYILPLNNAGGKNANLCGNKAASLSKIINKGINVPKGFCLTKHAYETFINDNGIDKFIITELGRKKYKDMRWEELWDASLRIRNLFTNSAMPKYLKDIILDYLNSHFTGKSLAIRSSSLSEDSPNASFTGIHESFINQSTTESIIQSIKLVWASLWSDAALLYREELSLAVNKSAMAVIIQEMMQGEVSGIAFCESPYNKDEAIIESIFGLNKGLVDGDIEPDRFIIDKKNKTIKSIYNAQHSRIVVPIQNGVKIAKLKEKKDSTLNNSQLKNIYNLMERLESLFLSPQDIEWTIKGNDIYILQSRPITTKETNEKQWYLSLKRSFDNLIQLASRIEKEILPQMEKDANNNSLINLTKLKDDQLILEIEKRKKLYDKWNQIYWEECIPFAHGVRLFATVYNDKIHPEDAFEFIELILPDKLKSTERNTLIEDTSLYLKNNPDSLDKKGNIKDKILKNKINEIAKEIGITLNKINKSEEKRIIKILKQTSNRQISRKTKEILIKEKTSCFIESFADEEKEYAKKLIWLAKKSYQLRDDDNIYLGRLNSDLALAIKETNKRVVPNYKNHNICKNAEEAIKALKFPSYIPPLITDKKTNNSKIVLNIRQLRGQPAGKGIARGKARIIESNNDLYKIKKDEIIICDAIDPTMTFIIPIASAIVERRGGMLIHGAIIAREYGIPCVTGIPNATEVIKNGDDITVDGYYGMVTNHSRTLK